MEPAAPSPAAAGKDRERWSFLLVVGVAVGITLPLLGAVGYFDPWETNYGEVAREMVTRNDYLYPFWKDAYFFSKPVLLFWLTAPLYKLIGAGTPGGPIPALAELCGRLPSALASVMCVAVEYYAARRLWGRRAALYASLALATMPLWAFLSRQAITDMLYVAPASAALLLLAVALFDDDKDTQKERLPRWLVALAAACTLPQLAEIARSGAFLNRVTLFGSEAAARGVFAAILLLFAGGLLYYLWRAGRDPLLHAAAILFALSTLAKGPVGVGVCGLTLLCTIAVLGEWERMLRPAAVSCTALFLAICAPWPIVMTFFTGLDEERKTWVQRFIFYDLLGRIGPGAHGDRGSFNYYVEYAGFGMFPWTGLVPPALFSAAGARAAPRNKGERFTVLVALWAVITFAFFAATTTKFHHYIFPLCVPCALLIGRYLDKLVSEPKLRVAPVVAFFAVTLAALIGRDLVTEPWQLIDLFTYHYKSYKPAYYFPSDEEWRVGLSIACFGATLVVAAGAVWDMVRPPPEGEHKTWLGSLVFSRRCASEGFITAYLAAAILFAVFAVQVHFNRASQHWSQREIFDTYYSMRKGDEPIIAFQMDWKGETFYGKNQDIQIKRSGSELKKAVERPGREFVLVQTDRYGSLKSALGKDYESRIKVVDRSNQKWYLVLVE